MSGTEDYLDGLLNSISEKDLDTKKKTGSETMQTEEDIMNDMENDLLSKEAEDNFLEQFEKELQNEKSAPEGEKTDDFSWEDLRGKSVIAGRAGGMPYMIFIYVLLKNGLKPGEDVEVINNIQFNLMGGAFEGGTGDYVTLFEPTATLFERNGSGHIVANVGLESGEVPYTTFMTMPDTIKKEPKLVESFIRAVYKAQLWLKDATDAEAAEAMLEFFPDADVETLKIVANSYRKTDSWMADPIMTEEAFTRLQDIIDINGELKARVEFGELVDNSFAEAVVKGK